MDTFNALSNLTELLHRAFKAQMHYAQDHPQTTQSLEAAFNLLTELLHTTSPLILTFSQGRIRYQGRTVEGAPNAAQSLTKEMVAHGIHGVAIHQGIDRDELQLLLFALQLQPQRLAEMGGPTSLLPEDSNLRFLDAEAPPPTVPQALRTALGVPLSRPPQAAAQTPVPAPAPTPAPKPTPAPAIPKEAPVLKAEPIVLGIPIDLNVRPAAEASTIIPPTLVPKEPVIPLPEQDEPWPPQPAHISPAALAGDLRMLFSAAIQMTELPPVPSARSPWSAEQRETIKEFGFLVPDFTSLVGTGEQLELSRMDPITLRDTVRAALASLPPMTQGAIVLGLPTFPSEEQALRRALDYLAPEFLAQAVAEVQVTRTPSKFELALLVAGLLTCVRDRDLTMEAIRGRLQFEGWTIQDLDELKDAILWECHGTDTKLRMSLMDRGLFDLDVHQVAILNRQLLKAKRTEGIKDLLDQLETAFISPESARRRHASEIVADLSECLGQPGLLPDMERQIFKMLHANIEMENDHQAMVWSCQAMEALLGHWIRKQEFEAVKTEMLALGDLGFSQGRIPSWKAQAIRDLLLRLANPINMDSIMELLHTREGHTIGQLHSLLGFMGRPAAEYLVAAIEREEDRVRRGRIMAAIRVIGKPAVPALKEALASPQWFVVRNAAQLLGEIRHKGAFDDVALALEHRDARVRRAAIGAVTVLGEKTHAAEVLTKILPTSDITTQLDCLAALGELRSHVCVPTILDLLQNTKDIGDDSARLRLRCVEVLGLIGAPETVNPLRDLFKKKGILGGRESTAIRLAAAKSLAAINTRESREAIALALESEPQDDIRAVLRQFLVSNPHA